MSEVPQRLLRDALRRTAAKPSSSCIDAETLAAWTDGSLRLSERGAFESHAASCERCHALIAAMARATPPAAPRRWWRTTTVGWLVPVAAAAAALVLWIAAPDRIARAPLPGAKLESQVALTPTPPAAPPSSPASLDSITQPGTASTDRTEPTRLRSANGPAAARAENPRAGAEPASPSARAAAPFTASKDEPAASPNARTDALSDVRADPSRVEAGASSDAASSPDRRLEAAAAAPQASVNSTLARSVVRDAAKMAAAIEIVSPDAKVRWRISGTNVEHSDDGGMTWQTQPTGVTAVLTSGAAPSPSVCWIVGASGTVVRSVDGRSWQRIAFHDAIDLRAVRASDATHAVVTAVDGRAFATGDGGRTWQANGR